MPVVEVTPKKIADATAILKALANEHRLLVLCHLAAGEKSVTELEKLSRIRQPTLSQQLARLRAERLVKTRRDAKRIYYDLNGGEVRLVVQLLHVLFCSGSARLPESLTLEFAAGD